MFTGKQLGDAIAEAIQKKGVKKSVVAREFGIKPPSLSDWIKSGRVGKQHLDKLIQYFADVVPPSHFGLHTLTLHESKPSKEKKENQYLDWAKTAMHTEAEAVREVAASLDGNFVRAAGALLACTGRVIVTGMGKSGHIARKIAATFASTGTPAFFVHPAEAAHGDLGMVTDGDAVLALSNSGESDEILAIMPALNRKNLTVVCINAQPQSAMARHADIHITAAVSQEACPLGLAPTSSTTAVLALGDALAVVLLKARSFTPQDFALSHPAGSLGRRLLLTVADIMHAGNDLPAVPEHTPLKSAVVAMSGKGLGMLAVTDGAGCLKGVLTDGDLRRLFERRDEFAGLTVNDVMTAHPAAIAAGKLAAEAVKIMREKRINCLPVTDEAGKVVGALNMHDLLKARVV